MFSKLVQNAARGKNYTVKKLFPFFEKSLGIHITPVHYFSPIPTTYELKPEVYSKPFSCKGLDWNESRQLETMNTATKYLSEYTPSPNSGLSLLDAKMLYTMIRERKPKLMIEIGSGETTKIALMALKKNREEGHAFRFVAIEPYPSPLLKSLDDKDFELVVKKLQDVELSVFEKTDLLFIDSTHVSRIDSDVNYEILEIVPALPKGAFIHWHDIPLPMNYWKEWIKSGNQFWNESYILHAFLLYNNSFSILWGANYMRIKYFAKLQELFPYLTENHKLSSFWIQKNN